jgi:cytidine deaminase
MTITKREFLQYTASALAVTAVGGATVPAHAKEKTMHASIAPILRKADTLPQQDVVNWLKELRGHPYVAQSGFDVTSVFKVATPEGIYYVGGVNVENRELTTGTCGEEGAIAAAVAAFGQRIDIVEGWVMGAPKGVSTSDIPCYPCGECRQRIAQYTAPDAPVHIIALDGTHKDTQTRAQLLPNAFSFRDLEHTGEAVQAPELAPVADVAERLYRTPAKALDKTEVFAWMSGLRGDVRVSGYNEMTVWRLANGAYVAGVKVENAAYPSSTNVQAAAAAVMNGRFGLQQVQEAWVYGAHVDNAQQALLAAAHHQPSGASLQILSQFAATPQIALHRFNGLGVATTQSLATLLPNASRFDL